MATLQDYAACERVWGKWARDWNPSRVLLCSGNRIQREIINGLFVKSHVENWGIEKWSLNDCCPQEFGLIIACNVFHYSPNPDLWFANCLGACKQLWVQDLVSRPRGPNGKEFSLADAGDCVRYGYGGVHPVGVDNVYDLHKQQSRLMGFEVYDAGSFKEEKAMINFVAQFRGDMAR